MSSAKEENKIWVCAGGSVDELRRAGLCFFKRTTTTITTTAVIFTALSMPPGWVFEFLAACSVGDGKKAPSFFEGIGGAGRPAEDARD